MTTAVALVTVNVFMVQALLIGSFPITQTSKTNNLFIAICLMTCLAL